MIIQTTGSYDATCQYAMRRALEDILGDGEPVRAVVRYQHLSGFEASVEGDVTWVDELAMTIAGQRIEFASVARLRIL